MQDIKTPCLLNKEKFVLNVKCLYVNNNFDKII